MRGHASLRLSIIGVTLLASLSGACNPAPTSPATILPPVPTAASADDKCLPAAEYDLVTNSDIIVAGWIEGWQGTHNEPTYQLETIHPRIDIQQVLKGQNIPTLFTFTDNGSLTYGPTLSWGQGDNACGAFVFDPTGQYAILGLKQGEDGKYYSDRSRVFFIGTEPTGEEYTQALNRLRAITPTAQP